MANETNFFTKKILIWREATKGVTPTTITQAYSITALSFSLVENQKTESNPALGNGGQPVAMDMGGSDFAGNIECKYTGGIMPILANQIIGVATKTNASSASWVTATVTIAGAIINGATYSLVCKVGGTTGATAPVVTSAVEGDIIVDGTVTWVYRASILKKYVGSMSPCLETVGVEIQSETGCGTLATFKERFTGVFFNSLEISKAAGNVIYKYSVPAIAMGKTDSTKATFAPLIITTESKIVDNSFGYDDVKVTIGGVEPENAKSFKITLNRNTALEYGIKQGQKIDNTPIPTLDGELVLKFTVEQYAALYDNPSKAVVVLMSKVNGDSLTLTFPTVETLRAPATYATNEPIYLTTKLSGYGSSAQAAVSYECISTTDW